MKYYNHLIVFQIVLSDEGNLHIIRGDGSCHQVINIGVKSLVTLLSHDLIIQSEGLEILVATTDGDIICLKTSDNAAGHLDMFQLIHLYKQATPIESVSVNQFSVQEQQVNQNKGKPKKCGSS